MVTQDEWAEKFKKVLSANPNATRKEIVDSVLASFPAHDRPAEPSVGERLTFFAEATIGGDGMKRYVMKATPGRGPPGKVALVTPTQAQQPTTAHAVEAVVAPSEEAHPVLPSIERQPGMAVLPTHPEEIKSAVAYKGPSELFRGTVWFRRYIEEAQLSKSTDPWQVNFPDGSFWQFEVPLPAARSDYKPRKMPGGLTDLEVIQELLMKPGNAVLMIGHSGGGKSSSVAAAAGDPAWDFNKAAGKNPWDKPRIYRAVMSNMSYEQLIGQFVPNKHAGQKAVGPDGKEYTEPQFKWMDGVLTRMVRYGGIFIADEINATQPDVLIAVNSLLDKDRYVTLAQNEGEVLHAHPQFRFIAAMNPQGYGYVGVKPLNDALKSRFSYTFWFDWDESVEQEIFKNVDEIIPGVKMSSVHEMFVKLRDSFRNNFLHYPPGTRDKEHFVGNVMTFKNVEHAIISLLMLYGDPKERKRAWAIIQPIFGDKAKKLSAADGERLFS